MQWDDGGNVSVDHPRAPWVAYGRSSTVVHCRTELLKGTAASLGPVGRAQTAALYRAAKFKFNMSSAFDLVERVVSDEAMDRLIDVIMPHLASRPLFVVPHPVFDDEDNVGRQTPLRDTPTNAIPYAYGAYLAAHIGGDLDDEIVQCARVGRSKLTTYLRFLCQPSFTGVVSTERPYVLVDDVVTAGGTFAALYSYIKACGGTVIATTALACNDGQDRKFEVAQATLGVLQSLYGSKFDDYWKRTFGHVTGNLTESEAQFLVWWAGNEHQNHGCGRGDETLHRFRDRINQASTKGC
jgi:hypothetical protein